jgi:lysophospholipase L1-like esterase
MNRAPHPIHQTLLFFLSVGTLSALFMLRPASWDFIEFPRWSHLFEPSEKEIKPEDISMLLAAYSDSVTSHSDHPTVSLDSLNPMPEDSVSFRGLDVLKSEPIELVVAENTDVHARYNRSPPTDIHENILLRGTPKSFELLGRFFEQLDTVVKTSSLHVLHFGDSQIEGDRMTSFIRQAWQKRWGGSGPGFLSPIPTTPSLAMKQSWSTGWKRHARYGKRDTTIGHNRYGLLASFATHATDRPEATNAWLEFRPNLASYSSTRKAEVATLLLGQTASTGTVKCYRNEQLIASLHLPDDSIHVEIQVDLMDSLQFTDSSFENIRFEFEGTVPEVDAIGFSSKSGVVVHNIGMRGSSGTLFRQLDRTQLTAQLRAQKVGLVILQFGGNAVPYIADSSAVERYGHWFASQIRLFKQILPDTPVLVIGPSDMSTKVENQFVTYPMLEMVRSALAGAAWNEDALFWDVLQVMGGKGSMAAWVTSEPPLASSDHVHFTWRGAKHIAQLLDQSIDAEWSLWKDWKNKNIENPTP